MPNRYHIYTSIKFIMSLVVTSAVLYRESYYLDARTLRRILVRADSQGSFFWYFCRLVSFFSTLLYMQILFQLKGMNPWL
jgi:hypothetical protein